MMNILFFYIFTLVLLITVVKKTPKSKTRFRKAVKAIAWIFAFLPLILFVSLIIFLGSNTQHNEGDWSIEDDFFMYSVTSKIQGTSHNLTISAVSADGGTSSIRVDGVDGAVRLLINGTSYETHHTDWEPTGGYMLKCHLKQLIAKTNMPIGVVVNDKLLGYVSPKGSSYAINKFHCK